jgi:heme/copper-type cytochrome/quinol oxidase subunit 4
MRKVLVGRLKKMFEEIAADAVKMLMFLFFVTLAFIVVSGALWLRASKNNA